LKQSGWRLICSLLLNGKSKNSSIIRLQPTVLTVALMLQCCIRLSSVTYKRCVSEQKLLLTVYRKSYMRNRLVPKWMTLTFV